ncbi:MAG: HNH endonuclease signature motif containing protein [Clostridia bacterium]|nr:HNH endonuclease signature motif containing protein [Clostridia bacterium]
MKRLSKADRQRVFEKYNGHCAYCGCELEYKDMQVDHFEPLRNWDKSKMEAELWDFNNLMPACRKCNHYKRAHKIETFRQMIQEIPKKLARDSYIYRIGIKYSLISAMDKPVKFYFERVEENENNNK